MPCCQTGDNLAVLELAHKACAGFIKMIYLDPRYGPACGCQNLC